MRGSVFKRCTCPARTDDKGRKVTCGKQHGSWTYKVDVPSLNGARRQVVRGGFPTRKDAEQAMAETLAKAHRGLAPRRPA